MMLHLNCSIWLISVEHIFLTLESEPLEFRAFHLLSWKFIYYFTSSVSMYFVPCQVQHIKQYIFDSLWLCYEAFMNDTFNTIHPQWPWNRRTNQNIHNNNCASKCCAPRALRSKLEIKRTTAQRWMKKNDGPSHNNASVNCVLCMLSRSR